MDKGSTRLHSSRMRTARALSVYPSMLGGCLLRGVSAPGGMCLLRGWGVCSRGVSALGVWYPSMH